MSQMPDFFDVWFTRGNELSRNVPRQRVLKWIEEHRLASIDKIRPNGESEWVLLRDFLANVKIETPKETHAELIPLSYSPPPKPVQEASDEVDMIPLIDVSLVLLVYYLMSTSTGGEGPGIPLPTARYATLAQLENPAWVEVESQSEKGLQIRFGVGNGALPLQFQEINQLVNHLKENTQSLGNISDLTIYAPPQIPAGIIRNLSASLETNLGKPFKIHLGVAGAKE